MLAAVPAEKNRVLEMFHLALSMAGAENNSIPAPLASYFDKVLKQAHLLLTAPEAVNEPILPEAIQLALDIRDDAKIRDAIGDIASIHSIAPEKARNILATLEG